MELGVKVVKPNGDIIEYVYDGNGNRYSKSINGEKRFYHYDIGSNIISETDESGGLLVKYVRDIDGQAISMIQGSNTYYFLYNAHGDVTSVANSSGNVVASYAYDEFGNIKDYTEPQNFYNPLRYSGANNAYFDNETGLYKMGVRYYNPEVGRWITRDKAKGEDLQSMNKYAYAENNPVTYFDSSGFKKINKTKKVERKVLSVPQYQQKYSDSCWAADVKMVIEYLTDSSPSEDDIIKYVKGDPMPEDKSGDLNDMKKALKHWGLISKPVEKRITWGSLKKEIKNNRPFIAAFDDQGSAIGLGSAAHAYVVKGYSTDEKYKGKEVLFNDPWDGKGHATNYDDFITYDPDLGLEDEWLGTVYNIKP